MIRIGICDDEPNILEKLKEQVSKEFKRQEKEICINTFISGKEFLGAHETEPFDVVFLDIRMPDINGFEVAKRMRGLFQKTYIIFITNESSLVYDSFDFQPFHFISKGSPEIFEERLSRVVKRLCIHISANKKIIIKAPFGNEYSVDPISIISVESSTKYVVYCFTDKPSLKIRQKLDEAMSALNTYLFARIHNRYIVNMRHIKRIDYPNFEVTMNNDRVFNISRTYKKELERLYDQYIRNFE